MVFEGSWRMVCERKSEYGKSESEINGKDRKYEWVIDGMREDKKGNMKLMRD